MAIKLSPLLFLLAILPLAWSVSSTEAASVIGTYVGEDNIAQMDVVDSTLEFRDVRYYVFYYSPPPVSKNKLVGAVAEETGLVISDEADLSALATAAHRYAVLQELEKTYSMSFSGISTFISDFKKRLSAASPQSVITSIQTAYPTVGLSAVERELTSMDGRVEIVSEALDQGASLKQAFVQEYSYTSLSNLFNHYNRSIMLFSEFLDATEEYQKAVLEAQDKVRTSKNLSVADKENILKALSPIYEAGDPGRFKETFSTGAAYYVSRVSDEEKWVGDSVSGFLFLKAKGDALTSYANVQPRAQSILGSEFSFKACALTTEWSDLSTLWTEIESQRARATRDAYLTMFSKLGSADALVVSLNDKYNKCIQAPTAPPSTGNNTALIQAALALVVLALIGYSAYKYYKKKQEEAA